MLGIAILLLRCLLLEPCITVVDSHGSIGHPALPLYGVWKAEWG
jgi:hypothetical protein